MMYTNSRDFAHHEATSLDINLDAAALRLNEMVDAWDDYTHLSELTESTLDQMDEVEQTKGAYSKITLYTPDQEDMEMVVETNLIRRQLAHLPPQIALHDKHIFSQIDEAEQIVLNPKVIVQRPSAGFVVTATDWGIEPLTPDVSWEYARQSISPYLPDVIGDREDNAAFLLFSRWTESLTANTAPEIDKNTVWNEILERLDVIAQREDNWDGCESKKPIEGSVRHARHLMEKLLDAVISEKYSWGESPYICSDEDGYVTVEWYGGERQLHLRIEEDKMEYIQLQRINNKRKMHADTIRSDDCFALWKWLINEL